MDHESSHAAILIVVSVGLIHTGCVVQTEPIDCLPGSSIQCAYGGPGGVAGVGACKAGARTCGDDGTFNACEGEVLPAMEDCSTPEDEDCDGTSVDLEDGCLCDPGATESCYSGSPETEGIGACKAGLAICALNGKHYEPCIGEVTPAWENCATPDDENCDGMPNDGCACAPGDMVTCYSASPATEGVGVCHLGFQACQADGFFGPCVGEVIPTPEDCATPMDDDCDGDVFDADAGCLCVPGAVSLCYSGPTSTQDIGQCKSGTRTCAPTGDVFSACIGQTLPSIEHCNSIVDESCDGDVVCHGYDVWSKGFYQNGQQESRGIAIDSKGNVLVVGHFYNGIDLGGGQFVSYGDVDIFLAKFDPSGQHLWSKHLGGPDSDDVVAVTIDDADNIIVGGSFNGQIDLDGDTLQSFDGWDIFVAKFDPDGNNVWSKRFGGPQDQILSSAYSRSSDIVIAGHFAGTLDFEIPLTSAGGNDIFLAKLSASGELSWDKRFGDAAPQQGRAVTVDKDGDVYLAGINNGKVDFGGGELISAGGWDATLAKFDGMTGSHIWSKEFGDTADQYPNSLTTDEAHNVIVVGMFAGSTNFGNGVFTSAGGNDGFLAKFSPSGAYLWGKAFGGVGYERAEGVATDDDGNIVAAGFVESTADFGGGSLVSAGGRDAFVAKYDSAGKHVWSRIVGDAGQQEASRVTTGATGAVFLAGRYAGAIQFGNAELVSAFGTYDVYVTAMSP